MYLTLSIGGIVGPAVGGLLVATVGAGWAIIGDALTFAVSGALLARIQALGHAPRPRESFWQRVVDASAAEAAARLRLDDHPALRPEPGPTRLQDARLDDRADRNALRRSIGIAGTLWETTLQQNVPAEALSRVAAYDWMGSTALRPLGLAIVGPIAEAVGVEETLLAAFALTMVSSLTLLAIPEMWRIAAASHADRPGVTPDETFGAAEA